MTLALYQLYIDPGTGSALFSIIIGLAVTVYFAVRSFIVKIKSAGFAANGIKLSKNYNDYVIYCEGRQYINVFLPVLEEFEKRNTELLYLTGAQEDPAFNAGYKYIKPEYVGEGNKAFARLNFLSARVVLATTPGLNVYQWKRSKGVKHYSHVLHMTQDATRYEMFGTDYFDSVLLTGDYQAKDIRKLEKMRGLPAKKLVTVGCTYLDELQKKISLIEQPKKEAFTVLLSPTWGNSGLLKRFGTRLIDPLKKTGWHIIIRPHPQSSLAEKKMLDDLAKNYEAAENIEWDFQRDGLTSLARADIMISDFSGIIFDFIFLFDKPVLYINEGIDLSPYDAQFIDDELWQFKTLKKTGIELKESLFDSIKEVITGAASNITLQQERQQAKEEAWFFRGEAGARIADFMLGVL